MSPIPAGLRGALKGAAERLTSGAGLARAAEWLRRDRVAVLSYHNIVPAGETPAGDRSLHLPERRFARQLDLLERHYEIVPLAALDRPGDGGAPRVAITFDDAYAGAVSAGLAELARRGLPATVFVVPGHPEGGSFWWDRIAEEASGAVDPARRRHAMWELRGDDGSVSAWARDAGIPPREPPEHARCATHAALEDAVARGGVTVGAHGWAHLNFAALPATELQSELERPHAWLAERYPSSYRPWLAYPYGSTSPDVERAAAKVYARAFRIEGGLAARADRELRPCAIPRINVPAGLSVDGLRLRVAGLVS